MSKLLTLTAEYIGWVEMELRSKMFKKGYSVWSLPKYKHGYLSACLTSFDYNKACILKPYVSIACMTDSVEDITKWIDSLPIVAPAPIQPIIIPYEGEMFI